MLEAVRLSHKKQFNISSVIYRMTMRNIIRTRRTLFMFLISASTLLIAFLFIPLRNSETAEFSGYAFFSYLMGTLQIRGILLLLSVFYGSTVFSDEVDRKTLIYLQARPVSAWSLLIAKYLSAFSLTAILLIFSTVTPYIVLMAMDDPADIIGNLDILGLDLLVMLLGAAAYNAMMLMASLLLKKPVLWGLAFTLLWENTVVNIPAFINKLTLLHWLQSIFPHSTVTNKFLSLLNPEPSPISTSIIVLLILTFVFLWVSWFAYRKKEFKLNTSN
jgi:ABC-type transport system involved in multi-copper enzyme maturation permease subunit